MALASREQVLTCCGPKPALEERDLLDRRQARQLEGVFKMLANSTRLRLLHALVREPGLCVTELAKTIGANVTAVSNHLQRLADRGILDPERSGTQALYRIVDPCVVKLLDSAWCLTEDAIERGRRTV